MVNIAQSPTIGTMYFALNPESTPNILESLNVTNSKKK